MKLTPLIAAAIGALGAFSTAAVAATQDLAGNNLTGVPYTSGQTYILDNSAPDTTITAGPASVTHSGSATFTFSGTDGSGSGIASYQAQIDSGGYATVTSPLVLGSLSAGAHTIEIRAVDAAGNVDPTPASYTWTIDTTAPDTLITFGPTTTTNSTSATFNFSGSDSSGSGVASYEVQLDGGGFAAATSPKSYTGLADGSHTFQVRAIDAAGNVDATPGSYTWTIDATAPSVSAIARATDAAVNAGSSDLVFRVTFSETVTGLDAGDFTLTAVSGTAAGHVASVALDSGSTYLVTVDQTAGIGALRLDLNGTGTGIADGAGNAIAAGYSSGEFYLVGTLNVLDSALLGAGMALDVSGADELKLAQKFKTASSAPLTVYRVAARIGAVSNDPVPLVTINADVDGEPGAVVATLTNPATLVANSLNVWEASATLQASTTYWVVFDDTSVSGRYFVSLSGATTGGLGDWLNAAPYTYGIYDFGWAAAPGALRMAIGALNAPAISSVTAPADGSYRTGQHLDFTVTFDAAVSVDSTSGTPRIPLTIGSTSTYAQYHSGTGTSSLVFRYTVQGGDNDADGVAITSPVETNGGTIKGPANIDAILTFTAPATGGVRVDNIAATVSSVSSTSANGTYKTGDAISITVSFDEAVTVTGTPTLALNSGGTATYASGTGTSTLTFSYTVGAGESAADLDYASTSALSLAGGAIRDTAANDATLTLPSVGGGSSIGGQKAIVIDGVAPTVASVAVPANGTAPAGAALVFTINFSEPVVVTGMPRLEVTLDLGGTVYASYASGSGTAALSFSYTVGSGVFDATGVALGALQLNSGTIRDAAGNNGILTLQSVGATAGVLVDGVAPAVTSIVRTGASLTNAATAQFTVTFTEAVSGVDTADFSLTTTGVSGTSVTGVSGSGSVYTVTVATGSGDGTIRLDATGTGIADLAGNSLAGGYAAGQVYNVDHTAPTLTAVAIASNNANASRAKIGDVVTLTFTSSEAIGTPAVTIAGHTVTASGVGNDWTATYAMAGGDAEGAVGFTIGFTDTAGNAGTAVTATTNASSVVFDGTVPTLTTVTLASNNAAAGWAKVGDTVTLAFTASETITTPTVSINGHVVTASHVGNDWTATYTLASGDAEGAVAFSIGFADVSGNSGTAVSTTTNASTVTFDKTAPSISVGAPSELLTRNGPVSFTVTYSDANFSGSTLTAGEVTVTKTGSANGTVGVTGSGNTRTVTISDPTGDGNFGITVVAGTATDLAGNLASGSTASATFEIDHTGPAVASIQRRTPLTLNASTNALTWRVVFAEGVTGVDAADFALTLVSGTAAGTISGTTAIDALTYDIEVTSVSGQGRLRLDLKSSGTGISDLVANPIADGGYTAGDFYLTGVENVFQTTLLAHDGSWVVTTGNRVGQRFTTAAAAPLSLTTVSAAVAAVNGASPVVEVYADNAGSLGAHVTTLTNPTSLTANALNVWTSTQLLEANKTYWVVFSATAGDYAIKQTNATTGGIGTWHTSPADYVYLTPDSSSSATHPGALHLAIGATSTPTITSSLVAAGTYGSAFAGYTITATNLPTSFGATGLPTGLSLDAATGQISGTPRQAGTFNVSLTGTNASGTGVPSTLVLTIAKAPLTVTANPQTRVYGAANPTFTFTYTGFATGDTATSLTAPPLAATPAISSSPVGTYDIVPSGGSSDNYAFSYVNGVLSVTKATAQVTLGSLSQTYDGSAKSVTATTVPSGLPVSVTYAGETSAPSAPGSYAIVATVNDSNYQGSGTGTLTIGKAPAAVSFGNLSFTYDGTPKSVTPTTSPAGLAVTVTYNGSAAAPTNAGTYTIAATASGPSHEGSGSATMTIAKAAQTVSFSLGTLDPGTPVALDATASSGLPVTYTVVSGPATVSGSTLTPTGGGAVTVRATQAGNQNFEAASADSTSTVSSKLAQTITFAPLDDRTTLDAAFRLSASASSGLAVRFTVLSGPAMLAGRTLVLNGTPGTVVIRASQPGNATYAPAADVDRSFVVRDASTDTYFGDLVSEAATNAIMPPSDGTWTPLALAATTEAKVGDIAAAVTAGTSEGTLLIVSPALGLNVSLEFTLNPDGTYTIPFTSGNRDLTVTGLLSNGTLTGRIPLLRVSFTTAVQPRDGATAAYAGVYQSDAVATTQGATISIVGTNGQALVLAVTPAVTAGGLATVRSDGTFTLATEAATISGAVDAPTATVSGTIAVTGQTAIDFSGLKNLVQRNDRLINLSTRARIGPSQSRTLITGFVIGGGEPKTVLVRAVGPGLAGFGLGTPIPNPRLHLYNAAGQLVLQNEDWSGSDTAEAIARTGAFGLAPGSRDAALVTTLEPGSYTMHVLDGGDTGVALAEIYDASANPAGEYQRLINVSSRGYVDSGDGVLVGGFVVTGNAPKKVLIRGAGPSLASFGLADVLGDPRLTVFSGSTVIAQNDNWETATPVNSTQVAATPAELSAAAQKTGSFGYAAGSKDAAIIIVLAPGAYTAQVSGANGATGVGLIEVYEIPE